MHTDRLHILSLCVFKYLHFVHNHQTEETLLALLGRQRLDEYEVKLTNDVGDILVEYVLAPDVERAAWQAMELSNQRNLTLKDVRLCDEW